MIVYLVIFCFIYVSSEIRSNNFEEISLNRKLLFMTHWDLLLDSSLEREFTNQPTLFSTYAPTILNSTNQTSDLTTPTNMLFSTSESFNLGQKIEGNWKGLNTFYKGMITRVHPDNTYDIRYVGGDIELNVPASRLKSKWPLQNGKPSPKMKPGQTKSFLRGSGNSIPHNLNITPSALNNSVYQYDINTNVEFSMSPDTPEERERVMFKLPDNMKDLDKDDINYMR